MRKGFELIELVLVLAILGVLAAAAIPKLSNEHAKGTQFEKPVQEITKAVQEVKSNFSVMSAKELSKLKKENAESISEIRQGIQELADENEQLKLEVQALKNMECTQTTTQPEPNLTENYGSGY